MKFDIKQAATYFTKIENWKSIALMLCFLFILGIIVPKQLIQNDFLINLIRILISSCSLVYFCKIVNCRIYKSEEKISYRFSLKEFLKIFFCCFLICAIFKIVGSGCAFLAKNPNYHIGNTFGVILFCSIILGFLESLLLLSYCIDLKFSSLFDINRIQFLVFYNFKYYTSFVITVVLHSLYIFIIVILTSFTIIIPLILIVYYVFFIADIQAQFIRKIYKKE